jgi:membrane protease YdiL (CAAX protease family)
MFKFITDKEFILALILPIILWLGIYIASPKITFGKQNLWLFIVIYPIIEELAFRGVIQEYLSKIYQKNFYNISFANLFTSILFATLHLINHTAIWAILVFIPSLIFGYFKDKFNSVIPSIFLHIFYNLGYFLTIYFLNAN